MPDLMVRLTDLGSIEVLADFAEHILVASLLEIGLDNGAGIFLGRIAGLSELFGRPQPKKLVSPRLGFETDLLVEGKLCHRSLFALIETSHQTRHPFVRAIHRAPAIQTDYTGKRRRACTLLN